ncbi:lymphocyte antigen 6L [Sorex araneus]|uniref:lymphocyte antigen 6L n=1 Tax=Sorex araneus TaxID=42254 RepID=UPI0003314C25|nr:lymphocyte antigen 6L [Sorex araneus]
MARDSSVMEQLVLVLGALLLVAEVAAGANLSCYQCFKATELELCVPTQCGPEDTICLSLIVLIWTCTISDSGKYRVAINPCTTSTIFCQCCSQSLCNQTSPAQHWACAPHLLLLALGLGLHWPLL